MCRPTWNERNVRLVLLGCFRAKHSCSQSLSDVRSLLQVMSQVLINEGYEEPDRKATLLQPGFELMNCSTDYMRKHFAQGDPSKFIPWGQLPSDITSRREQNPDSVAKLEASWKPSCGVRS